MIDHDADRKAAADAARIINQGWDRLFSLVREHEMNELQKLVELEEKDPDLRATIERWAKESGALNCRSGVTPWMIAFAKKAMKHAAEEAAKVCAEMREDAHEAPHKEHETYPEGWTDACNECGWAIEKRFKEL
jgi:hypothetical protein